MWQTVMRRLGRSRLPDDDTRLQQRLDLGIGHRRASAAEGERGIGLTVETHAWRSFAAIATQYRCDLTAPCDILKRRAVDRGGAIT